MEERYFPKKNYSQDRDGYKDGVQGTPLKGCVPVCTPYIPDNVPQCTLYP
jgi:hypothetical protein